MSENTLRGDRQHHEKRVYARRSNRFLTYPQMPSKYPGKTPGKMCSCASCGNRRRLGIVTRAEMIAASDDAARERRADEEEYPDGCDGCWWCDTFSFDPETRERRPDSMTSINTPALSIPLRMIAKIR